MYDALDAVPDQLRGTDPSRVLEGLQHLDGSQGRLTEVRKDGPRWRIEELAELPGAIVTWGFDAAGALVLHVAPQDKGSGCADDDGKPTQCVLRVTPEGRVSELP